MCVFFFLIKSPHYRKSHHAFKTSGNKSKTDSTTDGLHTLMASMGGNCLTVINIIYNFSNISLKNSNIMMFALV